jgi:capsule polysaccharide export protein KpsE/RkpR
MAARMVQPVDRSPDEFNAEQRMTRGQRTRLFVERELSLSDGSLRKAEDDLEHYQAKTKLVPLSAEVESAVSSGSFLLARKMEIEIQLGMRASILQESNEELKLLRLELAEIDRKLGQLPALGVEYARLVRDLKVREQVYGFLRTELEQAKIQEARDTPSLTIVDRADPPLRRTRPRRAAIALTAAGVTAVVSILGALVLTWGELLPPDDRRRHVLGAMAVI